MRKKSNVKDNDLCDLNKQDIKYINYINDCLSSENSNIKNAAYNTMKLIKNVKENPDDFLPEDLYYEFKRIHRDLNEKELHIINQFIIACTSVLNKFFNNEEVMKLKKKGMINYVKNK